MHPAVLIAEDEPDIQLLLKLTMQHAGHTCRAADDGQAALEAAQAEKPDLIILDVNMPRLNGYDACRKMRADENLAKVPVIFLSVRGAPHEITAGFEVGATEYLVKPFAPEQLLKVVGETLAKAAPKPQPAPEDAKAKMAAPGEGKAAVPPEPPAAAPTATVAVRPEASPPLAAPPPPAEPPDSVEADPGGAAQPGS